MSLKHTYTISIRNDTGGSVVNTEVITASAEENLSDTVPAGESKDYELPVDVDRIASFFVQSDKDLTFSTDDQEFDLTAKKALWWNSERLDTCPLTSDITTLTFDNTAGESDANIKVGFLLDLT